MKVYYMNGAGNDFMVIDARGLTLDYPALARKCCAITGADGFMATDVSDKADFRLHFYNSDGTRGEMCGNGARCICRFGHDIGLAGDVMTVETDAGLVPGWRLDENLYRVKPNNPYVLDLHRKGDVAYVELGHPGVPHAVAEYKGDLWADADKLLETFRALRFDPAFPKGANVNFYQLLGDGEIRILTFERGVEGYTRACGTGCGSVASVLWKKGLLPGGVFVGLRGRGGLPRLGGAVAGRGSRLGRGLALGLDGGAVRGGGGVAPLLADGQCRDSTQGQRQRGRDQRGSNSSVQHKIPPSNWVQGAGSHTLTHPASAHHSG